MGLGFLVVIPVKCVLLKVAIDSTEPEMEHHTLQVELSTHQEKATQGYQSLRLDTEYSKTDTNSLQQNLPVPTLAHSSMFYLRQLWVYNFEIHNCSNGSAVVG